jgi:hypothetical protein
VAAAIGELQSCQQLIDEMAAEAERCLAILCARQAAANAAPACTTPN